MCQMLWEPRDDNKSYVLELFLQFEATRKLNLGALNQDLKGK